MKSSNNIVIAITGPSGSGKSTIGENLAKSLGKCVNIDADHIKHMVVSGFYKDDSNPGGWSFSEWELVGQSIGLLAKNFQEKGFDVVINGYIDEPAWVALQEQVTLTHKVMLLPQLDKVIQRDGQRREDVRMGDATVKEHYTHFSTDSFFDDFITLDTTNHTSSDTVNEVLEAIGKADELE